MLELQIGGIYCKISLLFPAVLLLLLVGDTSGIACMSVLAAVAHEIGHLTTLCLFGCRIQSLSVSFYGIRLCTSSLDSIELWKRIVIYSSGPIINIVLCAIVLLTKTNNDVAMIHAVLAALNCIPISPLDGGRIIKALLFSTMTPKKALQIHALIVALSFAAVLTVSIMVFCMFGYSVSLLLFVIYLGICLLFDKGN